MADLIDVHVHFDDRACSARGMSFAAMNLQAFVAEMESCGVGAACLCAGAGLILEETTSPGGLQRANDILADACRRHPGRLFAYLLVHPSQLSASLRIIEQRAGDAHVIGAGEFLPEGHFHGHAFDSPEMRELATAASEKGLPLNIHTGDQRSFIQAKLLVDAVPRATVIFAHAGGAMVAETLALMAANPRVWLDLSAHGWKQGIREPLLASPLKHRFMFGSDVPIFALADAVSHFGGMGFAAVDQASIGAGNARTLFAKVTFLRS